MLNEKSPSSSRFLTEIRFWCAIVAEHLPWCRLQEDEVDWARILVKSRTLPFVEFLKKYIYGELLASQINHPQTYPLIYLPI